MTNIMILSATRTAIGTFGGSLSGFAPSELGALVARSAMERANISPDKIGTVVFGNVITTEPKDMYLSRVAARNAGIPDHVPAMNVNRLCGSGAQAVVSATQSLMLGDADFALAGGAEVMSRAPYNLPALRFGQKMGDASAVDMLTATLTCPFGSGHMGITAENIAAECNITRDAQDAFALTSQTRATAAIEAGEFDAQITPVEVKTRKGPQLFARDEHPRATTPDALAGLRPAFKKDGSVTAGNASGINDGAAAVVLGRADAVQAAGLKPLARILGYAVAGVAPHVMGYGPIPAVSELCKRHGLQVSDFDVIESNEAFAAQALAVNQQLGLDPAKVNPQGGAIALGHPVGATGIILICKALHYLQKTGGKRGLVTMCIGGGQGIALAFELV